MSVTLFGGTFLPSNLAGLQGWWTADFGVYSDAGITFAVDTNTVQQWNDKSVNGRNLSQGTAGNRPTYRTGILNSKPVIRFGGGTDDDFMLGGAASLFFTNSAFTIFMIGKHAANLTAGWLGSDSTSYIWGEWSTTGTVSGIANNDGGIDTATIAGLSSGTYYILTGMHSAGSLYSGANDTRTASMGSVASGNTTSVAENLWVGRRGGNYLDGDIAELLIYNVVLSEADRQLVERYLASIYAITLPY